MYILTSKDTVIENEERTVYGIRYNDVIFAEDISSDRDAAEELVARCNRCSLDPIHFFDVVDDFIAGL